MGHLNASGSGTTKPGVLQGTLIWGLPKNVTVYGGFQYTDNYLAALAGSGLNMGVLGAISADITQARSRLFNGEEYTGQSARFLYARSLNTLGTTFQLTGYRYSTRGFYTLQETAVRSLTGSYHDDERNNRRTPHHILIILIITICVIIGSLSFKQVFLSNLETVMLYLFLGHVRPTGIIQWPMIRYRQDSTAHTVILITV